jgi:epoxyqueuosine reductase
MLFLALGPHFALATRYGDGAADDPFDERATSLTQSFIDAELLPSDPASRLVYPGTTVAVDLRQCLVAARAQHPSRLGIGIRPDCGTWFAVRSAVATTLNQAQQDLLLTCYPSLSTQSQGPCATCTDAPCLRACPAEAVHADLDLGRCVTQRLQKESVCEQRCGAREACPVGREHMYPRKQVTYHYTLSLAMMRRWVGRRP